jgi:hypothetical protein
VRDHHFALPDCRAEGDPVTVFSGCCTVAYYDVECQTAHWAAHMEACYTA